MGSRWTIRKYDHKPYHTIYIIHFESREDEAPWTIVIERIEKSIVGFGSDDFCGGIEV